MWLIPFVFWIYCKRISKIIIILAKSPRRNYRFSWRLFAPLRDFFLNNLCEKITVFSKIKWYNMVRVIISRTNSWQLVKFVFKFNLYYLCLAVFYTRFKKTSLVLFLAWRNRLWKIDVNKPKWLSVTCTKLHVMNKI